MPNKEILIGINSNQDERLPFLHRTAEGEAQYGGRLHRIDTERGVPRQDQYSFPPFLFLLEGAEIYQLFLFLCYSFRDFEAVSGMLMLGKK